MREKLVDEQEVRRVAQLAYLELSKEEVRSMVQDLNSILGYMEKLRELDVSTIEPTTHAIPLQLSLRPDEPIKTLTREEILSNAPRTSDGMFEVPQVVEEGN